MFINTHTHKHAHTHAQTHVYSHAHAYTHTHAHICRPNWVMHMGTKYLQHDYVLLGWQEDDLPTFGRIQYIAVVNNNALFGVVKYYAFGIDRHYHSFIIKKTDEVAIYRLSELTDYQTFQAHLLRNGCLYITFHSHIANVSN